MAVIAGLPETDDVADDAGLPDADDVADRAGLPDTDDVADDAGLSGTDKVASSCHSPRVGQGHGSFTHLLSITNRKQVLGTELPPATKMGTVTQLLTLPHTFADGL